MNIHVKMNKVIYFIVVFVYILLGNQSVNCDENMYHRSRYMYRFRPGNSHTNEDETERIPTEDKNYTTVAPELEMISVAYSEETEPVSEQIVDKNNETAWFGNNSKPHPTTTQKVKHIVRENNAYGEQHSNKTNNEELFQIPMVIINIIRSSLFEGRRFVIFLASFLIITSSVSLSRVQYWLGKDPVAKYAKLEEELTREINDIHQNWKRHILQKQHNLFADIHNELEEHFMKIINDLQLLYIQARKMNDEVRSRMRYMLCELKKSNSEIKKNEISCLKEMEKISTKLLLLKDEEQLLLNELKNAAVSVDSVYRIVKEDSIFMTRFFQEVFLCVHVRLMIEKHEDLKVRQDYSKIALENLYWNLESISACSKHNKTIKK